MMKILIYTLLFLPLPVLAQNQGVIDSLHNEYEKEHYDTLKVKILAGLVWQYFYPQPEKAKDYASQVVELSKQANYTRGVWEGYNMFGVLHYIGAGYDSAITWFNRAVALSDDDAYATQRIYSLTYAGHSYQKLAMFDKADSCFSAMLAFAASRNDATGMAKGHKALAINYHTKGEYLMALQHYLKADSLLGDDLSVDKGEILQNIGITYHVLKNYKAEQNYYTQALQVYEKTGDDYGVNAIRLSLGSMEIENKNYDKATEYLTQSLTYFQTISEPAVLGELQYLLGRASFFRKQYREAENYYTMAIEALKDIEGTVTFNQAYRGLGEVYAALNENGKARRNYEKAYEYAQKIGELPSIIAILEAQADLYYKTKDYKRAYEIQREYRLLSDSMNTITRSKVIHEIEARYQNEKKQQAIELLSAENKLALQQRRSQQNIFLIIIVGALVIIVILFFLFRIKHKANRKLQQLDLLKSHFFSNISHEFRTPLTLIAGPIQNRLKNTSLSEQEREEFEMVTRNSNQLLGLVDQLLDLSKLEAGSVRLKIESSDLSVLLKSIAAAFHYQAQTKKIDYEIDIPDFGGAVWFDRDAVQKIVNNLISNAFKYTPGQGRIALKAVIQDQQMQLSVTNSGPGISQEDLTRIFERFYQVNGGAGGIGIGLALVKELVTLHGGTVSAKSSPGEQTTFLVILPVSKEALIHTSVVVENNKTLETNGNEEDTELVVTRGDDEVPLVLLVEDNSDIRAFIKSILAPHYTVLEAANGTVGIALAFEHIPDLIISDIMMPDTDGLSLCRKLKTDERTSHVPIILLTAKAGEEDTLLGYETGADDYIIKPFNSDLLTVRIRKLIEVRKQLHERFSREVVLKPKEIKLNSTDELFLQKVQAVLEKNLTESSFNAEKFAFEVGMSRMQLHRKLTGLTGLSANAFIRSNRLKMAAHLLTTSDVNIAEVGYLVGFNDPSYFAKCFREQYNCTPTQFSKKHSDSVENV